MQRYNMRRYRLTIEFEVERSGRYEADERRWAREVAQVAARAARRARHVDKSAGFRAALAYEYDGTGLAESVTV